MWRTLLLIKLPQEGSAPCFRPEGGLACPNHCHFFPKIYYFSLAASWRSWYIQAWHFNTGFFETEWKQGMSINWNNFIQMSGAGGICAGGGLVGDGALWVTASIHLAVLHSLLLTNLRFYLLSGWTNPMQAYWLSVNFISKSFLVKRQQRWVLLVSEDKIQWPQGRWRSAQILGVHKRCHYWLKNGGDKVEKSSL